MGESLADMNLLLALVAESTSFIMIVEMGDRQIK
jgi:hypothetical protein